MKAITITIPEDLDAQAAAEAKRRGISKSELIRMGLGLLISREQEGESGDFWVDLAGFAAEGVTAEPGEIDDVVYGT